MYSYIILICGIISAAMGLECLIACPRIYHPVCGHNGKTYSNACEARRQSCLTRTAITIVAGGPCSHIGVKLEGPAVCTADYRPVCGSDGKNYANKCTLTAEIVKTGKAISIVGNGECPEKCLLPCPRIHKPVCGSDGKQYGNECVLRAAACAAKKAIVVVSDGSKGNCKECSIPCTRIYLPVCGSDGVTYANECVMRGAACKYGAIVKINDGACKYTRECKFPCTRDYNPVCGSDGKKYGNECELRGSSCASGKAISVVLERAFRTDCSKCRIPCTRIYAPVCGSDGRTYGSRCIMRRTACKQRRAIHQVLEGKCQ